MLSNNDGDAGFRSNDVLSLAAPLQQRQQQKLIPSGSFPQQYTTTKDVATIETESSPKHSINAVQRFSSLLQESKAFVTALCDSDDDDGDSVHIDLWKDQEKQEQPGTEPSTAMNKSKEQQPLPTDREKKVSEKENAITLTRTTQGINIQHFDDVDFKSLLSRSKNIRAHETKDDVTHDRKKSVTPLSTLDVNQPLRHEKYHSKNNNNNKRPAHYDHYPSKNRVPSLLEKRRHHRKSDSRTTSKAKEDPELVGDHIVSGQTYTILNMIGYGGSSQVYRVFHKESKEILALKHVTTKRLSKQTYHDYRNEITFLVKLRQKNCLHIPYLQNYENNRIAGHLDIVLELGEIDFAHYMFLQRSKPLDYNFVRWYGQLMLEAVDEIHDRHVVHRDLKPANFILKEGSLKLIDFGISKKVDAQGYVEIDSPIGTVHYMPPEAFLFVEKDGRKYIQIGQFSDVWALGCIFYQMIYGKTPFHNVDADHKALYICDPSFIIDYPSSVSFDPPSGTSVVVPVKQDVISLLQACLDRDPQNRWSVKRLLKHPFFHPEHSL